MFMKKTNLLLLLSLLISSINGQNVINKNFTEGLEIGDSIESGVYNLAEDPVAINQWNNLASYGISVPNLSPKAVAPLDYTGYIDSGSSNAIALEKLSSGTRMSIYSLDDATGTLYSSSSPAYYLAFMINVNAETTATGNGAGIIAFNGSANANWIRGVFTVVKQNDTNFKIGLSNIYGGAPTIHGAWYEFGKPHLIVLKFDFVGQRLQIFVNPTDLVSTTEPAVTRTITLSGYSQSIRSISIFQRSDFSATIGGLRFARTWEGVVKDDTSTGLIKSNPVNNIIKEQYFSLSGQEVVKPIEKHFYIKKYTFSDGKTSAEKILYMEK